MRTTFRGPCKRWLHTMRLAVQKSNYLHLVGWNFSVSQHPPAPVPRVLLTCKESCKFCSPANSGTSVTPLFMESPFVLCVLNLRLSLDLQSGPFSLFTVLHFPQGDCCELLSLSFSWLLQEFFLFPIWITEELVGDGSY